MPDIQNINLSKIIKRLQLIKSLISLEEEDEIDGRVLNRTVWEIAGIRNNDSFKIYKTSDL